jgi:hypothetical protein
MLRASETGFVDVDVDVASAGLNKMGILETNALLRSAQKCKRPMLLTFGRSLLCRARTNVASASVFAAGGCNHLCLATSDIPLILCLVQRLAPSTAPLGFHRWVQGAKWATSSEQSLR